MNSNFKKEEWERSYAKHDNYIFYPKEETIKFLNRFVRKRVGLDEFIDIIPFDKEIRGLDFGCGIGRITILLKEFGINAYGIDISQNAIQMAKQLTDYYNFPELKNNFVVANDILLPFEDNYFDITISEAVLDSMSFELAKKMLKEIDRVTTKYFYLSLISGDNSEYPREFSEEVIVNTSHEKGTIQTFYNFSRIKDLIVDTNFKIHWCRLIKEEGVLQKYLNSRYYIVLEKEAE